MRLAEREYWNDCTHVWRDKGETFKTYPRQVASRDNPVRVVQRCHYCGETRTAVVGYSDTTSERP